MTALLAEFEWARSSTVPPGTPPPSGPPSGPSHPTPTRPGEPAPPKNHIQTTRFPAGERRDVRLGQRTSADVLRKERIGDAVRTDVTRPTVPAVGHVPAGVLLPAHSGRATFLPPGALPGRARHRAGAPASGGAS